MDYIRLIRFFDNALFRIIKDFIPGRSTAITGIIIKPHKLERNKAKHVSVSTIFQDYSGSIDTAFTVGTHGGSYTQLVERSTAYSERIVVPSGSAMTFRHNYEEPKFNGELSGSRIKITDGELNRGNRIKKGSQPELAFRITFINQSNTIPRDCTITFTVTQITPAPTAAPTAAPTPSPTAAPTAAPTPSPTAAPVTPSPTAAPVTPAPVTPAPVTPAPVTPSPTAAPVTPAPVTPAPVTPAPVTPAPVTPAPITPSPTAAPVTPAPTTPSPTSSPQYDYFFADVFACNGVNSCNESIDTIYVMVNVNNPPPIPNKFYVTSTGPDGYAYRVNSATFSSGVALELGTQFGSFNTCALACMA